MIDDLAAALSMQIANGAIPSMLLWGAPGTGKTTLAQIIAQTSNTNFFITILLSF